MKFLLYSADPKKYNYHLHYGAVAKGLRALGHVVETVGTHPLLTYQKSAWADLRHLVEHARPDCYISLNPDKPWQQVQDIAAAFPALPVVASIWDLHYVKTTAAFVGAKLCLVRHRHAMSLFGADPRAHHFPFSVDPTAAPRQTLRWDSRHPQVFFAGATNPDPYPVRARAIRLLAAGGLMHRSAGYSGLKQYLATASRFRFGLACVSRYRIQPAKVLEYAQVGTIPLIDEPEAVLDLLPGVLAYDLASVVLRVRQANGQVAKYRQLSKDLAAHVAEHHTHAVRARQLLKLLGAE